MGLKAFVLSDGWGYFHRVVARETLLNDRPDLGHTPKVVLTLVKLLAHKGYDLYTDRYYTSPIWPMNWRRLVTGTAKGYHRR